MADPRTPQTDNPFLRMSSEVSPEASPLLRFLERNGKKIAVALGACLVAGAAYGGYTWNESRKTVAAQDELGRIMIIRSDTDRLAKLQAFLPTAPTALKPGLHLAVAKTATAAGAFPVAADAWAELAKDAESPLYPSAVIGQAESLLRQGKHEEALETLSSAKTKEGTVGANLVQSALVDAAEEAGKLDRAVAAADKLVAATAAVNPQEADFWRQKAASLRLALSGQTATPPQASTMPASRPEGAQQPGTGSEAATSGTQTTTQPQTPPSGPQPSQGAPR